MSLDFSMIEQMLYIVLTALSIVLLLDGLLYAMLPAMMKRAMTHVLSMSNFRFRLIGLGMAFCGAAAIWMLPKVF